MTFVCWSWCAGGDDEGTTIFVKGFDRGLGEDAIKEALGEAFGECGTVVNIRLPFDQETQQPKGFGYIEFDSVASKVCSLNTLPHPILKPELGL